jgi:DNA-binding beta-propeller fold protein YncE
LKHSNFNHIASLSFAILGVFTTTIAQEVSTVAGKSYVGNGEYVTSRNNPLLDDYYSNPIGLSIDSNGYLNFTDEHNLMMLIGPNSLSRIGTPLDPLINGGFANGAATSGLMNGPAGLAVNPITKMLYICDQGNHSIRLAEPFFSVSNTQMLSTLSGNGPSNPGHRDGAVSNALFNAPYDIVFNANGDCYVSDQNNNVIRKISNNIVSTIAGGVGLTGNANGAGADARFNSPAGLYLDIQTQALYVADIGNRKIRRIDLQTGIVNDFISAGLFSPRAITKVNNHFFINDLNAVKMFNNDSIQLFAGSEDQANDLDGIGENARFYELADIIFNPIDSFLYVTDKGVNTIKKISVPNYVFDLSSDTALINKQINTPLFAVKLYPNPSNQQLTIHNSSLDYYYYYIMDSNGKLCIQGTTTNKEQEVINVKKLPNAAYFLVVKHADNTTQKIRFIIQHE